MIHRARHGNRNHVQLSPARIGHLGETAKISLQRLVVGVLWIFFDRRDNGRRSHETRQLVDVSVGVVAFDAGAVDYVMKPVDPQRLAQAVTRLQARLQPAAPSTGPSAEGLQTLLAQLAGQLGRRPTLDVIQAGVGKEVRLIRTDEVIYFEADSRYTRVVHEGGEALIRTPLKELLGQLDANQFAQVHRSVVVNLRAISHVTRGLNETADIYLKGRGEVLPVSRSFLHLFKQM